MIDTTRFDKKMYYRFYGRVGISMEEIVRPKCEPISAKYILWGRIFR